MTISLVSGPATEPITTSEAKAHARITSTGDDALIGTMITAARHKCESITRRSLITQTLDLFMDDFPATIKLPRPKVQSVTSVKYIDTEGTQQTLATSAYRVDTDSQPARVTPAYGTSWPAIRHVTNAVVVRYVAGYGTATAIPEDIKAWMKIYVSTQYENREQFITFGTVNELPYVDGLLDSHRVHGF